MGCEMITVVYLVVYEKQNKEIIGESLATSQQLTNTNTCNYLGSVWEVFSKSRAQTL